MMFKNNWYNERKKLSIEQGMFNLLTIAVSLYVLVTCAIFLMQYLNPLIWNDLVSNSPTLEGFIAGTFQEKENMLKLLYLAKFWGSIGLVMVFQISLYIYFKKTKYGNVFIIFWGLLFGAMTIINITMIVNEPLTYIWKLIPLLILTIGMVILFFNIFNYRKRLKGEYYRLLKKGVFYHYA